ncbi:hypothetical protein GCM10012284_40530 [Mangrovihabitans endophyticus]|uniref:Uncharacterized protein n=1 Tax=Mangrovihabitans endophyticus TaxID=1751298 RepID=A0A8J3C2U3_9ACTN|nr:hypothetical protein GCM10012284_40530 [Mangrovihabitans endophyticus]
MDERPGDDVSDGHPRGEKRGDDQDDPERPSLPSLSLHEVPPGGSGEPVWRFLSAPAQGGSKNAPNLSGRGRAAETAVSRYPSQDAHAEPSPDC